MQAQTAMAVMLPHLAPLLHDPAARVRRAMAELLEHVGQLRTLDWWAIVPATRAIAVLGSDTTAVAAPIQRLLMPAFLPQCAAASLQM